MSPVRDQSGVFSAYPEVGPRLPAFSFWRGLPVGRCGDAHPGGYAPALLGAGPGMGGLTSPEAITLAHGFYF